MAERESRQPTSATWEWADNPAYAGRTPAALEADCHDKSPFITIVCGCGGQMHIHETQLAGVQPSQAVAALCKSCERPLVFEPGWFAFAFADLRRRGWLAPRGAVSQ